MKDNQKKIEDTFNECLESIILDGRGADDCLPAGSPHEAELQPLLQVVSCARAVSKIRPDAGFRARARNEFRTALGDVAARKKGFAWGWSWRSTVALPLAAATLMVSGGGVLAASSVSLPDSPLYGIKLAVEDIQFKLTPSGDLKTSLYAQRADRRIVEIISLAVSGNVELIESTVVRLESDLNNITGISIPNPEVISSDSKGQTGGTDTFSPSTATAWVTQPEAAIPAPTGQAPGTSTPPRENSYGSANAITDRELLEFLISYAGKHPDELVALLDTVPSSARPLLEYVIQLTSAHQQTLNQMAAALD